MKILLDAHHDDLEEFPPGCVPLLNYERNLNGLCRLIERKEWELSIERIVSFPEEAKVWVERTSKGGGTLRWMVKPIHMALLYKSPWRVIEALLQAYPEGARCHDDMGMLPIHVAMKVKCDDNVIGILLEAHPEGVKEKDPWGRSLLTVYDYNCSSLFKKIQSKSWDEALEQLLSNPEEAKSWVIRKEKNGLLRWKLLPLHAAIIFKAPLHFLGALLAAYPQGALHHDDQGMTPLHLVTKKTVPNGKIMDIILKYCPLSSTVKDTDGKTAVGDYDKNPTELFHWIDINDWEKVITQVNMFPEEARTWVVRIDDEGDLKWRVLPIHLAIACQAPNYVINSLLTHYPQGSRCQDDAGLLPLHLAFKQCSSEDPATSGRMKEIINSLIQVYPEAVNVKDNKDRMPITYSRQIRSTLTSILSPLPKTEGVEIEETIINKETSEQPITIVSDADDVPEKNLSTENNLEGALPTEETVDEVITIEEPVIGETVEVNLDKYAELCVSSDKDGTPKSQVSSEVDVLLHEAAAILHRHKAATDDVTDKKVERNKKKRFSMKNFFGKINKKKSGNKVKSKNTLARNELLNNTAAGINIETIPEDKPEEGEMAMQTDQYDHIEEMNYNQKDCDDDDQTMVEVVRESNEDDLISFVQLLTDLTSVDGSRMEGCAARSQSAQNKSSREMDSNPTDNESIVDLITNLINFSSDRPTKNIEKSGDVENIDDARDDSVDSMNGSNSGNSNEIKSSRIISLVDDLMADDQDEGTVVGTVTSLIHEMSELKK